MSVRRSIRNRHRQKRENRSVGRTTSSMSNAISVGYDRSKFSLMISNMETMDDPSDIQGTSDIANLEDQAQNFENLMYDLEDFSDDLDSYMKANPNSKDTETMERILNKYNYRDTFTGALLRLKKYNATMDDIQGLSEDDDEWEENAENVIDELGNAKMEMQSMSSMYQDLQQSL